MVASGTGTPADPHVVSTLPSESCRAITFSVIDEVARVAVPVKETITYTAEPTGEE